MLSANQIYNYIENAVNTQERPVYCSSVNEPIGSVFPACQISELTHVFDQRSLPLSFAKHETTTLRREYEVHVFSNLKNQGLSEARSIMDDVEIAFKQLSFIETACTQTDNADPNVIHLVARFTRTIGDGDEIDNN